MIYPEWRWTQVPMIKQFLKFILTLEYYNLKVL